MNSPQPEARILDLNREIVIRPGTEADAQAVIDIVFPTLRSFGIEPDPERWDAEIVAFGRNPPEIVEFVTTYRDAVVGVAVLKDLGETRGFLRDLYVKEEFRGKGLGRQLLAHMVDHARRAGFSHLELETRSEFEAAIHLYESTGWERGPDLRWPGSPKIGPDRMYFLELMT